MRVIIADDSRHILDWLKESIGRLDQVEIVGAFKNGTDALDALRKLKPDLAIIDIKMPGLNGLEVLTEIRKVDKSIKIIILTFFSFEHQRIQAIDAGADYFFSKVDEFDKVFNVISDMQTII